MTEQRKHEPNHVAAALKALGLQRHPDLELVEVRGRIQKATRTTLLAAGQMAGLVGWQAVMEAALDDYAKRCRKGIEKAGGGAEFQALMTEIAGREEAR